MLVYSGCLHSFLFWFRWWESSSPENQTPGQKRKLFLGPFLIYRCVWHSDTFFYFIFLLLCFDCFSCVVVLSWAQVQHNWRRNHPDKVLPAVSERFISLSLTKTKSPAGSEQCATSSPKFQTEIQGCFSLDSKKARPKLQEIQTSKVILCLYFFPLNPTINVCTKVKKIDK